MAKGFKLRISLPSIRICRSKKPSAMPKSPSAVTQTFTPQNPKTFDIVFPMLPAPPPSTPNHSFKISQFGSKISTAHLKPLSTIDSISPGCVMKKNFDDIQKLCNSPVSQDFDEFMWGVNDSSQTIENSDSKEFYSANIDPVTSFSMSVSSGDNGFFSFSSEDCEQNDESEGLLSSCSSFDSSYDFGYSLKTRNDQNKVSYGSKRKKKIAKLRRMKRFDSDQKINVSTSSVGESYAVMKRSADPYEDFKRSMLEMILEKQISEDEDLEKLLMCFLSLNDREHHAAIVHAFTEVWEELFCKS